jgi:hypothetical protein
MIPERERQYTEGNQFDHVRYWHDADWGHPLPPQAPDFWCAVHARPLTWREAHCQGEGLCCSWCRDPMTAPPSQIIAS